MEINTMLKALQDPMGIPFYPFVFQILMVLTFALHIMFVNFALGTSFLSIYGYLRGGDNWSRLSKGMARATTVNISTAMVLGVAPLLFVQVVYDPFWYSSNTLSAAWAIAFVFIMMLGYGLTYVFYLKGKNKSGGGITLSGILAFLLLLLAGVIMHALNYQLLQPEKWLSWYSNGNSVDASGTSLYSFQLSRFLHFIIPAFAMTGIFMMLYAWYFKEREDFDKGYLEWVGKTGANMAFTFTLIQAVVGLWWLFSLPRELNFYTNPLFLIGAILGVVLLVYLYNAKKDPAKYAIGSVLVGFITIFAMSYAREALRMKYVGRFDYSIFDYKLNIHLESTILFLLTFLMGLGILGYLFTVAFKAGRVAGVYEASSGVQKYGRLSIGLVLAWLVVVAGLGVVLSVKYYL